LGDFKSAIKWQEKAIELATEDSEKQEMLIRLGFYTEGKPYRDMPKRQLLGRALSPRSSAASVLRPQ
jgi:hypothetical protein